jgi:hypothetical protein
VDEGAGALPWPVAAGGADCQKSGFQPMRRLSVRCHVARSVFRPRPCGRSLNTVSPLSSKPVRIV